LRALAGLDHPADASSPATLARARRHNVGGMRRGDDEDAVEIADDDIARPTCAPFENSIAQRKSIANADGISA